MAKIRTIEDQLREAIKASGMTHYRIGKEGGFDPSILDRFVADGKARRGMQLATAAKIAAVLGLELRPAKNLSARSLTAIR